MGLNKYQNCDFTSTTVAFYQKSIFDFLNPFTDISGYLNLWDIFRFIFRQLRMTFFAKSNELLNVKMINLEKIK